MTTRTYLLALAVQLMAVLTWRDCGPEHVIAAIVIVPLCVVIMGGLELWDRLNEGR